MKINHIVRQIVGRCHVAQSDLSVIRYVVSRLKAGRETFLAMPRLSRKVFLKQIVACHRANRDEYDFVMRGGKGYPGPWRKYVKRAKGPQARAQKGGA